MALEKAALVRALGQIELVFSFMTARYLFKQKATKLEVLGLLILVSGLLLIVLPEI